MGTLYVDTDVSGGAGDGSNLANAYSSLNAALLYIHGLGAYAEHWTVLCHATAGTADTVGITLMQTGDFSLTIEPGEGQWHNGVWDASIYRLETGDEVAVSWGSGGTGACDVHIYGLQIRRTITTTSAQQVIHVSQFRSEAFIVESCIIRGSGNTSFTHRTVQSDPDGRFSGRTILANNLFYDITGNGASGDAFLYCVGLNNDGPVSLYRNTIIGPTYLAGRATTGSNAHLRVWKGNLITASNLTWNEHGDLIETGSDYNAFTTSTVVEGDNNRYSQTFTFEDIANHNYDLDESDTGAKGNGMDLSSDEIYALSVDIMGRDITSNPSIGAFEFQIPKRYPRILFGP